MMCPSLTLTIEVRTCSALLLIPVQTSGDLLKVAIVVCVSHACDVGARDEQSGGGLDRAAFLQNYSLNWTTMLQ
jgi:hypothetical protein